MGDAGLAAAVSVPTSDLSLQLRLLAFSQNANMIASSDDISFAALSALHNFSSSHQRAIKRPLLLLQHVRL